MTRAYRLTIAHPIARALSFGVDLMAATADAVADFSGDLEETCRWLASLARAAP